jgi:hypothetical protein
MATVLTDTDQLERELLRRGVGALAADRHRCVDCGRTPLIGERVYRYDDRPVCELCRVLRPDAPSSSEVVRHSEYGHTVRLTARAA